MDERRQVSQLASSQRGLVTRAQLLEAGFTARMIDRRLQAGGLVLASHGVYEMAGLPPDRWRAGLAACLAAGGTVAFSHRASASIWGGHPPMAPMVDLSLTPRRSVRIEAGSGDLVLHRSVDLTMDQIVVHHGLPVTRPARTLVDLGAVVAPRVVEDVLDDFVGRKLVTIREVRAALERLAARGRSGCGVLREVLDRRAGAELTMSRSRLEAELIRLCERAGLPHPVFQHELIVGGRRRRLDFAFPGLRLAIEVDGYESHSRYHVFEDDRARSNDLELAGWTVLHFTWTQVTQRPGYVVSVLRAALAQSAAA